MNRLVSGTATLPTHPIVCSIDISKFIPIGISWQRTVGQPNRRLVALLCPAASVSRIPESPRPLDAPRPRETESRWHPFAPLTGTPLRASLRRRSVLAGSGDDRDGLALSESTRIAVGSSSVGTG